MSRKYLIPFLSFLIVAMLAYALQAHAPSWQDFLAWFGLAGIIIGGIELITGLILLLSQQKKLAKEFLITALLLVLIGGGVCTYTMSMTK